MRDAFRCIGHLCVTGSLQWVFLLVVPLRLNWISARSSYDILINSDKVVTDIGSDSTESYWEVDSELSIGTKNELVALLLLNMVMCSAPPGI